MKREFDRLLHQPGRTEALPLSAFIDRKMHDIVAHWEAFARTLLPGTRRVSLKAHGARDAVTVAVKNEGPPIPAEALQVIFNPLAPRTRLARKSLMRS